MRNYITGYENLYHPSEGWTITTTEAKLKPAINHNRRAKQRLIARMSKMRHEELSSKRNYNVEAIDD